MNCMFVCCLTHYIYYTHCYMFDNPSSRTAIMIVVWIYLFLGMNVLCTRYIDTDLKPKTIFVNNERFSLGRLTILNYYDE